MDSLAVHAIPSVKFYVDLQIKKKKKERITRFDHRFTCTTDVSDIANEHCFQSVKSY